MERAIIQQASTVVSLVTIVVLAIMVYRRILSWRYAALPILILVQRTIFYLYVFVTTPPPNETNTTISALIWLEAVVALLVVLLLYWKAHKKNG